MARLYLAEPVTYVFSGASGTSSVFYTFADLLVTILKPGDIIPIVLISAVLDGTLLIIDNIGTKSVYYHDGDVAVFPPEFNHR